MLRFLRRRSWVVLVITVVMIAVQLGTPLSAAAMQQVLYKNTENSYAYVSVTVLDENGNGQIERGEHFKIIVFAEWNQRWNKDVNLHMFNTMTLWTYGLGYYSIKSQRGDTLVNQESGGAHRFASYDKNRNRTMGITYEGVRSTNPWAWGTCHFGVGCTDEIHGNGLWISIPCP
jgi:hypothetical protein